MNNIITPALLEPGNTIGIIAPARFISIEELEPFLSWIEHQGYRVLLPQNIFKRDGQFAGSARERIEDIHQLFSDPGVKAVFAARGGYGTAQLLADIDWEMIKNNPKWLVGFSDITALHSPVNKYFETIHGFMPFSFVMKEPQDVSSLQTAFDIMEGKSIQFPLGDHSLNVEGQYEGQLTGGNLSVLYSLSGTSYEPDYRGKILFLEELDEYLYHVDRMLLNFELRGIFDHIGGLIVGDFSDMHDNTVPFGKTAYAIISRIVRKYNIPAYFGFPAGHKKSNLPQIFGRVSTLTVKQGNCSLRMY